MNRRLKSAFGIIIFIPLIVTLQSCLIATKGTIIVPQIAAAFKGTYFIDPYMEEHKPHTVAVLPFLNQAKSHEGSDAVRKGFYNHFSSLPFKNMKGRAERSGHHQQDIPAGTGQNSQCRCGRLWHHL